MKKVIFAVKRLYSFISEFVVLIDGGSLDFWHNTESYFRLKKSVARIYIIYMRKKILC